MKKQKNVIWMIIATLIITCISPITNIKADTVGVSPVENDTIIVITDENEMDENDVDIQSEKSDEKIEIETNVDNDELEASTRLETNIETGEITLEGEISNEEETLTLNHSIELTYADENNIAGVLVDKGTGEETPFDTRLSDASAVPLIIIAVQIARFGIQWGIKKYGKKVAQNAIKQSAHAAAKGIKKSLIGSNDKVIIKKFTQNIGKQVKKDPNSGWTISRDVGKGNAHGGSHWKLVGKDGKRKATLDKSGKILRK